MDESQNGTKYDNLLECFIIFIFIIFPIFGSTTLPNICEYNENAQVVRKMQLRGESSD